MNRYILNIENKTISKEIIDIDFSMDRIAHFIRCSEERESDEQKRLDKNIIKREILYQNCKKDIKDI